MREIIISLFCTAIVISYGTADKTKPSMEGLTIFEKNVVVSLRKENFDYICGLTIISNLFGVTAARCIQSYKKKKSEKPKYDGIFVQLNNLPLKYLISGSPLKRDIEHLYTPEALHNDRRGGRDFGVVQLKDPVYLANIPKVEFPESDVTVDQKAYLLGWGSASVSSATLGTDHLRKELKKIKLSITSTEIEYFTAYENHYDSNTNAFSAKSVNSLEHINNLDFGCPVFSDNTLIGIVSYGRDIRSGEPMTVFINVYKLQYIIDEAMKDSNFCLQHPHLSLCTFKGQPLSSNHQLQCLSDSVTLLKHVWHDKFHS